MMDIGPFENFLSDLSKICGLDFEVWDRHGSLYASKANGNRPIDIKDLEQLSTYILGRHQFGHRRIKDQYSLFGIPINNGVAVIGSLMAYGAELQTSDLKPSRIKEKESFLINLRNLLSDRWTFQREAKEMADEIDQSFEELYLYSKIATQVRTLKFTGSMQRDLIEDILSIMRVDFAFADLPEREEYNVMASKTWFLAKVSNPKEFLKQLLGSIPPDVLGSEDHYFIVNDSTKEEPFKGLHPDPYRFLAVKIQHKEDLYGWLGMVSFNLNKIFRQSELSLLVTMAEQIAVVISNNNLYRDLEGFVMNVVKSLVNVIEAKDGYTRGHSERVSRYCMKMAEFMRLPEEQKKEIHWASILHDIGKIGIPEAILNKPSSLNNEEFDKIKQHPEKGFEILQPIEQLKSSLSGILYHHERYDGQGYPDGLEGTGIPLIARMISVADTFDAITSERAYREAKTPKEAITIMEQVSGSQLDAKLVLIFKEIMKNSQSSGKEVEHGV